MKRSNVIIYLILLMVIVSFYGCADNNESERDFPPEEEKDTLSLSQEDGFDIPSKPSKELEPTFEFVEKTPALKGTAWKLNQIIKNGEQISTNPDADNMCYTLWFYTDDCLLFHTSRNMIFGYYRADEKTNLIRTIIRGGFAHSKEGEFLGVDFWQGIIDADRFRINGDELRIIPENDSYLLFEKLNEGIRNSTRLDEARWALTQLYDIKSGKQYDIDREMYDDELLLWFANDSIYTGRSLGNVFGGRYIADSTTLKCVSTFATQVGEPILGELFCSALSLKSIFMIKDNMLTIENQEFILTFKSNIL